MRVICHKASVNNNIIISVQRKLAEK